MLFVGWLKEIARPWRAVAESDQADVAQARSERYCKLLGDRCEDTITLPEGQRPTGSAIHARKFG